MPLSNSRPDVVPIFDQPKVIVGKSLLIGSVDSNPFDGERPFEFKD